MPVSSMKLQRSKYYFHEKGNPCGSFEIVSLELSCPWTSFYFQQHINIFPCYILNKFVSNDDWEDEKENDLKN